MANEYCIIDDVQEYYQSITFSGDTKPNNDTIEAWITRSSRRIDSIVGRFYSVPVTKSTSPNSFSILKDICIKMVKHRIDDVMGLRTKAELQEEEPPNLYLEAIKELKEIVDYRDLYDAVRSTSNNQGVEDYNYQNDIEPHFDTETTSEQW